MLEVYESVRTAPQGLQGRQAERAGGSRLVGVARHEHDVARNRRVAGCHREVEGVERTQAEAQNELVRSLQDDLPVEGEQRDRPAVCAIRVEAPEQDVRSPDATRPDGRLHGAGKLDAGDLARYHLLVACEQEIALRLVLG